MIGATASALQGQPVWGYVIWGFPSALVVAILWTQFTLSTTAAELHLRPGQVALRTVYDVLRQKSTPWKPLYKVQVSHAQIELSVGWNTHVLRPRDWPKYEELKEYAQRAHHSAAPE